MLFFLVFFFREEEVGSSKEVGVGGKGRKILLNFLILSSFGDFVFFGV